ncbi:MAG: DUF7347 domain-containing protein [Candidatus Bathyarchaeia archaeon]
MTVDFESFNDVLKHPLRRKVLLTLGETPNLSYVELLNITEATNTGKFNYHLKILGDLIKKDANGKYALTEKGQLALQLLQKFPEKNRQQKDLHFADASIMGLLGAFLVAANPAFWIGLWLDLNEFTVPAFTVPLFGLGAVLYTLFVPSFVMHFLAVKRTGNHELYNLLRAPLVTCLVLLGFVVVLFVSGLWHNLVVDIKSPLELISQGSSWTHSSQQLTTISLVAILMQGIFYSFIGVVLIELISRVRKRLSKR